jgi:ABC-2 type transport system ATP-binding protein
MASDSHTVVSVQSITKDFRPGFGLKTKRVLHDVSFEVAQGEIFGFVGPNGAGKTTTLKVLMGLIRATSGKASILGCDVAESEFRQHIGFLPENPYFYTFLTGRETLEFYARLSGVPSASRADRVEEVLRWVGLEQAASQRLRTYSKGMCQRVGIGQALLHDPSVVFLDEPMSGLDPLGRKDIRDIIHRLKSDGKTVFMNTHILSDVEMVCDRVAIIVGGHIQYQGRIDEFLGEQELRTDLVFSRLPAEVATQIEATFEASFKGLGERVEIHVPDKQVSRLLMMALEAGGEVVSVAKNRVSLESVFLETVAKSRRRED